jgi:hypothetical protein
MSTTGQHHTNVTEETIDLKPIPAAPQPEASTTEAARSVIANAMAAVPHSSPNGILDIEHGTPVVPNYRRFRVTQRLTVSITLAGLTLSGVALWLSYRSMRYDQGSLALAQWTATKEFLEHCASGAGSDNPACAQARKLKLPAPPGMTLPNARSEEKILPPTKTADQFRPCRYRCTPIVASKSKSQGSKALVNGRRYTRSLCELALTETTRIHLVGNLITSKYCADEASAAVASPVPQKLDLDFTDDPLFMAVTLSSLSLDYRTLNHESWSKWTSGNWGAAWALNTSTSIPSSLTFSYCGLWDGTSSRAITTLRYTLPNHPFLPFFFLLNGFLDTITDFQLRCLPVLYFTAGILLGCLVVYIGSVFVAEYQGHKFWRWTSVEHRSRGFKENTRKKLQ